MNTNRVVVTGMGTVNSIGNNVAEFWENSLKGSSGISKITHLFSIPEHMSQIAGVASVEFTDNNPNEVSRNQRLANIAVNEALNQSKILDKEENRETCSVAIATAIAEISLMERMYSSYTKGKGHIGFVPLSSFYAGNSFHFNHVAQQIANNHSIKGGAITISTGCTGGNDAVGYALHMIRNGRAKAVISGSVDAPITPLVVGAFSRIGATSLRNQDPQSASRPFDSGRDGFVLAEGCGILILEDLEHAVKRDALILAEVAGFNSVNNHYHMIDIHRDGTAIAQSCLLALKDAKVSSEEVDFIHAHGSSTPQNDLAESQAFHLVFKENASRIPVTSIKSQLGHPLSAANSIELISAILSICHGKIPPTINLFEQDPECKLNVVGNRAVDHQAHVVMKPSSGFSGIHSCIILKKYYEDEK